MSRDQRPGKIRVVANGSAPRGPNPADAEDEGETSLPDIDPVGTPQPASGFGWRSALLFLGGCAAGGAGFAVLSTTL